MAAIGALHPVGARALDARGLLGSGTRMVWLGFVRQTLPGEWAWILHSPTSNRCAESLLWQLLHRQCHRPGKRVALNVLHWLALLAIGILFPANQDDAIGDGRTTRSVVTWPVTGSGSLTP